MVRAELSALRFTHCNGHHHISRAIIDAYNYVPYVVRILAQNSNNIEWILILKQIDSGSLNLSFIEK